MSIAKLADRILSAVVPTTDAAAGCGTYQFRYYRCCATPFKHRAFYQNACGESRWGSCISASPECG